MSHEIVTAGHPSAASVGPSRDTTREMGVGTAVRYDANMTPVRKAKLAIGGRGTKRPWGQSRAVEHKGGVLGRPGQTRVAVKSANNAPAQVGFTKSVDGIAAEPPVPTSGVAWGPLMIAALALGGAFMLLKR